MKALAALVGLAFFLGSSPALASKACDRMCSPAKVAACKKTCPQNCNSPSECEDCKRSCEMLSGDTCKKQCAKALRLMESKKGKAKPASRSGGDDSDSGE